MKKDGRGLQILCPQRMERSVTQVTVEQLQKIGVEAVLLDLDNTLVRWQGRDIPEAIRKWLQELSEAGFKLCLVSNTRFGKRLRVLSTELNIPYVRRAAKPSRQGFHNALKLLNCPAHKAVMIGDQMFTDVWGGNRSGIYTIMVEPIARREFIGTKISRVAERLLLAWFRRRGDI
ncbi:MAG: YqeG family HAD IIIA-type phosphatase [Armatimonadetes bacterium]|nr:YqeG family HAD IIIA-type phosphatase [Armatimonadota bacterium]